jgi:hypothetical protein
MPRQTFPVAVEGDYVISDLFLKVENIWAIKPTYTTLGNPTKGQERPQQCCFNHAWHHRRKRF